MLITKTQYEIIKQKLKNHTFHTLSDRILNKEYLTPIEYQAVLENTKDTRMAWWREARFGIFIHFGLYSLTGRGEWCLARDGIPSSEYETLAANFTPKENCAEEWVLTAKNAGAKYVVLTTRHHDGFSLWDSKVNPYNSYNYGCKRDIVREFVEACRKHDMKIGFYSSLMDWRHPDAKRMAFDSEARNRFLKYIEDLNIELLSNYGKIDILWYDMPYPNESCDGWNSLQRDQKLRALQPDIIINDRGRVISDFATCEEVLAYNSNDWEACLTFNTLSWGYIDEEQAKPYSYTPQMLVKKLCYSCSNRGNLLLNIGPKPDGSISEYEKSTLFKLGKWIDKYKTVIHSKDLKASNGLLGLNCYGEYGSDMLSGASAKENTVYIWNYIWPQNGIYYLGGYKNSPKKVYFADNGKEIDFEFDENNFRIILKNLPKTSPDNILGITIIAMEFEATPQFRFCIGYPHINDGHIERNL